MLRTHKTLGSSGTFMTQPLGWGQRQCRDTVVFYFPADGYTHSRFQIYTCERGQYISLLFKLKYLRAGSLESTLSFVYQAYWVESALRNKMCMGWGQQIWTEGEGKQWGSCAERLHQCYGEPPSWDDLQRCADWRWAFVLLHRPLSK